MITLKVIKNPWKEPTLKFIKISRGKIITDIKDKLLIFRNVKYF